MERPCLALILPSLCLGLCLSACGEAEDHSPPTGPRVQAGRPGPAPAAHSELAAATPAPAAEPTPSPLPLPPEPEALPEADPRKRALADIGSKAFTALRSGDLDALLTLTPQAGPSALAQLCPGTQSEARELLEARFKRCHETIDWEAVDQADVFTGELVSAQAAGCAPGIADYGRLQLFLHMSDTSIWRVDFLGAVGRDEQTLAINGALTCRRVDSAPKPR